MIGALIRLRRAVVLTALLASAGPCVAACRPADAAARGGQAGFDLAQSAAQSIASNEHSAQTALQKCLSSITARAPSNMFPSLGDIFGQLIQKVCYAVSDQVNQVTSQIDLTSQINSAISDINNQVGSSTGGVVTNPVTGGVGSKPVSLLGGGGATSGAGSSTDFWSTVWK